MMYISNFSNAEEVSRFRVTGARAKWVKNTEEGAVIEGVAYQKEVSASGAMHLRLTPGRTYTTVEYSAADGMPSDWTGHETLQLNFENASEFKINLHLKVEDARGRSYLADNLWVFRGRNFANIPLAEVRAADATALDLGNVARMSLEIRSAEKFPRDVWVFEWKLLEAAAPVVSETPRLKMLDFGPLGSPVFPGATLVHDRSAYAAWRGCGWTTPTGVLTSEYGKKPDLLTNHFVWGKVGDDRAALRVDLPDGRYRARFYGGNYNAHILPNMSFALAVDGRKVASKTATFESYYTPECHFSGINEWFAPGQDVYARYVTPFWQTHDFDFEARGGKVEFAWTGVVAAFGMLVAPEGKFAAAAEAVEAARRADFMKDVEFPKPPRKAPALSPAERKRKFILWHRGWEGWDGWGRGVGVYDLPKKGERNPRSLAVTAALGQREPTTLMVTPIEDIGRVSLEVSDLRGPGGAKLPSRAVDVRVVRYEWSGKPAAPRPLILWPAKAAPSSKMVNISFWLTVKPPKNAKPGIYRGKVTVAARTGKAVVPIAVDVRPFALPVDIDAAFSFFQTNDYSMNYAMRYWMPRHNDAFAKIIDQEFRDLSEHGLNSYLFYPPIIRGVDGGRVIIDFSVLDVAIAAAKKHGFCKAGSPGLMNLLPDVARYLMRETRYGDFYEPEDMSQTLPQADQEEEFSPLFIARYVNAASQIHERLKKAGLVVCMYPVDEPREHNINRWNRDLADTIRYCDIIRRNLPDALIWVDPMRHEGEGVDYLPILDHVDIISTHPWDQSERINQRAARDGRPVLQYFNSIMGDRYDYGYATAAANAKGFLQWCYAWDLVAFNPFHPCSKSGVAIKGPKGVISRPFYEVFAAAVVDYRYIYALRERIARAKESGRAAKEARAAGKALAKLLSSASPYPTRKDYERGRGKPRTKIAGRTLDQWRDILAGHIQAIDGAL